MYWDVVGLLLARGQRELTHDHSSSHTITWNEPNTWRGKRTQERVAFNRRSNLITNVSFTQARTCTSKVGRGQRPDLFKLGVEPPARHAHYLDTVYGFREWRKEGGVPVLAQRLVIPVSEGRTRPLPLLDSSSRIARRCACRASPLAAETARCGCTTAVASFNATVPLRVQTLLAATRPAKGCTTATATARPAPTARWRGKAGHSFAHLALTVARPGRIPTC